MKKLIALLLLLTMIATPLYAISLFDSVIYKEVQLGREKVLEMNIILFLSILDHMLNTCTSLPQNSAGPINSASSTTRGGSTSRALSYPERFTSIAQKQSRRV